MARSRFPATKSNSENQARFGELGNSREIEFTESADTTVGNTRIALGEGRGTATEEITHSLNVDTTVLFGTRPCDRKDTRVSRFLSRSAITAGKNPPSLYARTGMWSSISTEQHGPIPAVALLPLTLRSSVTA